jgi:hypothetical protein
VARPLIVEILGNATQFGAELDRAAGKTRQFSRAAGVAGLAIAGGLAVGLEKSVKAAEAAQASTARLNAAFRSSGENAGLYAGQISRAEDSSRKLGFSNIDVRESLGSLEIATRNHTAAINDLGTAEDLARFKHLSLADASKTLSMAMAGSQRAAHQLGITIPAVTTAEEKVKEAFKKHSGAAYDAAIATAKLTDKQKTAQEVIDTVSKRVHGQADAFSQTAAGGMAQFHAQIGNIEEKLGGALIPALTHLSQVLAAGADWLSRHATAAKILVGVLAGLATTLIAVSVAQKVYAAGAAVAEAATVAWTIATEGLTVAMEANPVGAVIAGLVLLTAALVAIGVAVYKFRDQIAGAFREAFDKVSQIAIDIKDAVVRAFHLVIDWVTTNWPKIAVLISGPFAPLVALATNAFGIRDKLIGAFNAMGDAARTVWDGVSGAWQSAWSGAVGVIKSVINRIIDAINWLIDKWNSIHFKFGGQKVLGVTVVPSIDIGLPQIPDLPHLAAGALVTRPTLAIIGEAGPEAVIPLARAHAAAAAPVQARGPDVHVTVGPVYGSVDQAFARSLSNQIATLLRSGNAPQLQQTIHAI